MRPIRSNYYLWVGNLPTAFFTPYFRKKETETSNCPKISKLRLLQLKLRDIIRTSLCFYVFDSPYKDDTGRNKRERGKGIP